MSDRTETFEAKHVVISVDDGEGAVDVSVYLSAETGTDVEISGSIAEITRFATDLIAALILKGDEG